MLNKDSRAMLKSLVQINNSAIIEDTIYSKDEFSNISYKFELSKLESEKVTPFGIFDMGSFLSALDLLEDPVIVLDNNIISATDTDSTLKFVTSDISSLEDISVDPQIIDSTLAIDSILEFNFGSNTLAKLKKGAATFKTFDTVYITNGEKTQLKLGTKDSFAKSNNSFAITVDNTLDTDKDFEIILPLDSLLKLPNMDYTLMVKYNPDRDAYRVVVQNTLLTFVMSLIDA